MNLFDYTQKKYWGAPWYPYWTLMVATIVVGFFGLDHFWLRSPLTGFLKAIANVLTLGLWYFYDIIQVITEREKVEKYGLSAPVVGPLGIGAGMFRNEEAVDEEHSKSPFRFLAYIVLLFFPLTFGLEYVVAGDMAGAIFKFIMNFIPPLGIIYTLASIGQTLFMPKTLFENGTYHVMPASIFLGQYGVEAAGLLGPGEGVAQMESGVSGIFRGVYMIIETFLKGILAPIKFTVEAFFGSISAALKFFGVVAEAGTKVGTTITGALDAVKGFTEGDLLKQKMVAGKDEVLGSALIEARAPIAKVGSATQVGGAVQGGVSDWLMIAVIAGTAAYFLRKKYKEYFVDVAAKKEEEKYNGIPIPPTSERV
jgi:hypothetical protein